MKPIRIGSASRIEIGYDGENGARAVVFDATKWMEEMPGCTAAITAQRADGQEYIAPDVTQDEAERTITWTLTGAETMEGEGRAQLLWMDGERIAKQAIFTTVCHESLKSDATQIGVPEPVWAQQSLAAAKEAKQSAEAAKVSEIGAQNALEETKGVRDAAKQEIDAKKEGALSSIESAKTDAIVSIEAGKDELAPPVIPEVTGMPIVATDSADRPLRGMTVYGKTTQDGTPSEDAPVDPVGTGTASPLRIVTAGRNLAALTPRTANNNGITSSYDAQTGVLTVTGTATGTAYVSYWLREPIPAGVHVEIGLGNGSSDGNITLRVQSASANTTIATLDSVNKVVNLKLRHAFEFLSIRVNAGATVNMKMQIGVTVKSASAGYTWTHPDDPKSAQIVMQGLHTEVGGLLQGLPAVSGGNYTDENGQQWIADTVEYDAQAGTAQIVKRVGSVTFDGDEGETWVKGGSGSYFAISRADKSSASHGLCTHYQGLAINAGENNVGFTAATDKEYIRFRPTGYADMTVDQWRARMSESPVTVLYALDEPVTTPITGEELAALTALRSRYPATTIYNDALAQMAVRYIADTKKYVDDADAEIEKAVIGVEGRVDAAMENIADAGERADAAQTKADENERNIGQLKDDIADERIERIQHTGGTNPFNCFRNNRIFDLSEWYIENTAISEIVPVDGSYCNGVEIDNSNGSKTLNFRQVFALENLKEETYIISFKRLFKGAANIGFITVSAGIYNADTGAFGGLGNVLRGSDTGTETITETYTFDKTEILTRFPKATHIAIGVSVRAGCDVVIYEPLLIPSHANYKTYAINGSNVATSRLYGKTMYYDGDSIAYGAGSNGKGFGDLLAKKYNMVVDKFAVSGATLSVFESQTRHNICTSVKENMKKEYDYMLFDGGYNDYGKSIPLGALSTDGAVPFSAAPDETTICGALESIFQYVQKNYPKTKIYYLLTHKVYNYWTKGNQSRVYELIKTVCDRYSVEVIDVFGKSGFCTYYDEHKVFTNNGDMVHPTEEGYNTFYLPLIERTMN